VGSKCFTFIRVSYDSFSLMGHDERLFNSVSKASGAGEAKFFLSLAMS
jgi:hypothetical protein